MSFQPVVPFGGFAGWTFLQKTRDSQMSAFNNGTELKRNTEAFAERIRNISTAEQLVADRQVLQVALGAFGLDDDLGNKFFVRKVLEEGTIDPGSLANRLADKRYRAMSKEFGFDLTPPNTTLSSFPEKIISAYRERQFEIAVGRASPDMRLALAIQRDVVDIAERSLSEEGKWFTVMANPPVREVFERALNLPASVGALDLDRQLAIFRERSAAVFGDAGVGQFGAPDKIADLTRRFLANSETGPGATANTRGSAALAILQSSQQFQILGYAQ